MVAGAGVALVGAGAAAFGAGTGAGAGAGAGGAALGSAAALGSGAALANWAKNIKPRVARSATGIRMGALLASAASSRNPCVELWRNRAARRADENG